MTTQEIDKYLEALNDELDRTGAKGAFQHSRPESLRAGTSLFIGYSINRNEELWRYSSASTQKIIDDPKNWSIYLMDFVDDFRYYRDRRMIEEPFELDDERFDALLAATAEQLRSVHCPTTHRL